MDPSTPRYPWIGLFVLLVICFAVAGVGGLITAPSIPNWYASLSKPSWTPPDWLFGPVWSVLYLSMALAAWLVWRQAGLARAIVPMILFGAQLLLNVLWSWLFFGLHCPGAAFVEVILLMLTIAVTMVLFWRRSTVAGMLFVPYFVWVSFASLLNFAIWRLNS